VLAHNWRHVWCRAGDASSAVLARADSSYLSVNPSMLYGGEIGQQYASALYWSLTMLMKTAYVGPDTLVEKVSACALVIVGAMQFALLLGNVVAMLTSYDKSNVQLRDKETTLHEFCNSRRVRGPLRRALFGYVQAEWRRSKGISNSGLLAQFPHNLHTDVLLAIHANVVYACPVLRSLSAAALKLLLRGVQVEVVMQRSTLIAANSHVHYLYILKRGALRCDLAAGVHGDNRAAHPHVQRGESKVTLPTPATASEETKRSASRRATYSSKSGKLGSFKRMCMVERVGSVLGFNDPFDRTHSAAPFRVTALKQSEVLVFERRALCAMLGQCAEAEALRVCTSIEAEYNKLLASLKATGKQTATVARRVEEAEAERKREAAAEVERKKHLQYEVDFTHPGHLADLNARTAELEGRVATTAAAAARVRAHLEAVLPAVATTILRATGDADAADAVAASRAAPTDADAGAEPSAPGTPTAAAHQASTAAAAAVRAHAHSQHAGAQAMVEPSTTEMSASVRRPCGSYCLGGTASLVAAAVERRSGETPPGTPGGGHTPHRGRHGALGGQTLSPPSRAKLRWAVARRLVGSVNEGDEGSGGQPEQSRPEEKSRGRRRFSFYEGEKSVPFDAARHTCAATEESRDRGDYAAAGRRRGEQGAGRRRNSVSRVATLGRTSVLRGKGGEQGDQQETAIISSLLM